MTAPRTARDQLAQDLKYLRDTAGLSQRDLAKRIDTTQSWIQQREDGVGTTPRSLKADRIEAWAEVTNADAAMRTKLRVLVDAIIRGDPSWDERVGEQQHLQEEMRAREATAHTIRNFQPTVVPGLLQTPEYAGFVMRLADVDGVMDYDTALAGRLRRQEALFTGGKQFEFLLGEAALRWPASQPEMLAAQLDRIVTLASLKSVSVAVLPIGEPVNVVAWSNFIVFDGDSPFVSMELTHREEPLVDDGRIGLYRTLYSKMWDRAVTSSDAVTLIKELAAGYRASS